MKDTDPSTHLPALSTPSQSSRCLTLRDRYRIHSLLTETGRLPLAGSGPENVMCLRPQGHFRTLVISMQAFHPSVWPECSTGGAATAQEKHSLMLEYCTASLITEAEIRHFNGPLRRIWLKVRVICVSPSLHVHWGWRKEFIEKTFFFSKQNLSEGKTTKKGELFLGASQAFQ